MAKQKLFTDEMHQNIFLFQPALGNIAKMGRPYIGYFFADSSGIPSRKTSKKKK